MAKLKEIETKWNAEKIKRADFNSILVGYLGKSHKFKNAAGFDYYYLSSSKDVWRHRISADTNELTIKARLTSSSTKVRKEANILLAKECSVTDIAGILSLADAKMDVAVFKDCDIYFVRSGHTEISIVWYKVKCQGFAERVFAEVEVHGLSEKKSLKVLHRWHKIMKKLFGLTNDHIVQESLYEIYSGRRYKVRK